MMASTSGSPSLGGSKGTGGSWTTGTRASGSTERNSGSTERNSGSTERNSGSTERYSGSTMRDITDSLFLDSPNKARSKKPSYSPSLLKSPGDFPKEKILRDLPPQIHRRIPSNQEILFPIPGEDSVLNPLSKSPVGSLQNEISSPHIGSPSESPSKPSSNKSPSKPSSNKSRLSKSPLRSLQSGFLKNEISSTHIGSPSESPLKPSSNKSLTPKEHTSVPQDPIHFDFPPFTSTPTETPAVNEEKHLAHGAATPTDVLHMWALLHQSIVMKANKNVLSNTNIPTHSNNTPSKNVSRQLLSQSLVMTANKNVLSSTNIPTHSNNTPSKNVSRQLLSQSRHNHQQQCAPLTSVPPYTCARCGQSEAESSMNTSSLDNIIAKLQSIIGKVKCISPCGLAGSECKPGFTDVGQQTSKREAIQHFQTKVKNELAGIECPCTSGSRSKLPVHSESRNNKKTKLPCQCHTGTATCSQGPAREVSTFDTIKCKLCVVFKTLKRKARPLINYLNCNRCFGSLLAVCLILLLYLIIHYPTTKPPLCKLAALRRKQHAAKSEGSFFSPPEENVECWENIKQSISSIVPSMTTSHDECDIGNYFSSLFKRKCIHP